MPGGGVSRLTRTLHRAMRWAERERDAAAGRMIAATGEAEADSAAAWRQYLRAAAASERDRAAWADDLARWLGDELGRRLTADTRAWVEREALAFIEAA